MIGRSRARRPRSTSPAVTTLPSPGALRAFWLSGTIAVGAVFLPFAASAQQGASPTAQPRLQDSVRVAPEAPVVETEDPQGEGLSQTLRPGVAGDASVLDPQAAEALDAERAAVPPEPVPETRPFDLFAGPGGERSRPLNTRNASPERERAAGRAVPDERPPTGAARRVFDPIGPVRTPSLAVTDEDGAMGATTTGLRRSLPPVEQDPFAAEGLRGGNFLLFPSIETSVGTSDNLARGPGGEGGVFSDTTASLRIVSQWSRHELEVNGAAGYRRNFSGELPEEPRLDLDALLRLDLTRDLTANFRGALAFSRESAFSADPLLPVEERPDVLAYSFGADLTRAVGPTSLTLTTQASREERDRFTDTAASDDFSTYSAGLRAQYAISPSLQPFATASVGRRVFDERDASLLDRDSVLPALRLGIGFDRGEKLFGEVALGYAANVPDADGLPTTDSPTLDARINWSPRRGTDVLLTAATFFDPSRDNLSTTTVYETSLGLRHRATSRLDLTGLVGASFRDRSASEDETVYAAEAGAVYWVRRGLALTALARHERLTSQTSAAEYDASSLRIGLRVQR